MHILLFQIKRFLRIVFVAIKLLLQNYLLASPIKNIQNTEVIYRTMVLQTDANVFVFWGFFSPNNWGGQGEGEGHAAVQQWKALVCVCLRLHQMHLQGQAMDKDPYVSAF